MTESNSNPRAESIEQVRQRVTKEVFIELGIYRYADSMTALVGFDAKVIGKLIESRILLEPSPCGVDGHLRKHWVEGAHAPHEGDTVYHCTLCKHEKAEENASYHLGFNDGLAEEDERHISERKAAQTEIERLRKELDNLRTGLGLLSEI